MIDKIVPNIEAALAGIQDGATIMIGGFGTSGYSMALNHICDKLQAQA